MSFRRISIDFEEAELRRQVRKMRCLVDERVGIVSHVFEHFREPDDPYVFNHTTVLAGCERYTGLGKPPQNNGGAGLTRVRSILGAIGEAIERYACTIFDRSALLFGSYEELTKAGHRCFPPDRIALFSDRQYQSPEFPFERLTPHTKVAWELCECLSDSPPTEIYFPAGQIYMPHFIDPGRGEADIGPTISTGQASGPNLEMATMSGLMEAVERDAFTICWHNRLANPRIDPRTSDLVSDLLRDRFAVCPSEVVLNYLTLDIDIPVVVATGVDRRNPEVSCILGVSAHMDPEVAAVKALIELAQDRYYVKFLARAHAPVEPSHDFLDIDDFEKRVVLYNDPRMIPALDFWRQTPETIGFDEMTEGPAGNGDGDLGRAISAVKAQGNTVLRRDCTPDDLRELGIYVVKVMIPEAQALEGNHNTRFFGCERLYRVPAEVGLVDEPLDEDAMNRFPHPLP